MAELKNKQQLINYLLNTSPGTATKSHMLEQIEKLAIKPNYPIILVGGTNGKGSTCAYLTTILVKAGYKVGSFTSPHVFDYNERICINNIPVNDEILINALDRVINSDTGQLGLFKAFLLACHLIFIETNIDIAVVEVGIGGKEDATNLFEPEISAITCVDIDHAAILGNSIEEIGTQKAGIFRPLKPAFFAGEIVPKSVLAYAKEINSPLAILGRDFGYTRHQVSWDFYSDEINYYSLPIPSLRGHEQLKNAALALAILAKLRNTFPVGLLHIKFGLLETSLVGRFQVLPGMPQIVLDTAHNPQAIECVLQNMLKLQFAKRNLALFGIANDKDWQKILDLTGKKFDKWFVAPIASARSCTPEQIKEYLLAQGIKTENIIMHSSVENALKNAYGELTNDDRLVCFGSFLVVEAAYNTIQKVR